MMENNVVVNRRKWILNKCCTYTKLKTGCLIIAYYQLIAATIAVTLQAKVVAKLICKMKRATGKKKTNDIMYALLICGVLLLVLIVGLVFAIILLIGLVQHKPNLVLLYLIFSFTSAFVPMSVIIWFVMKALDIHVFIRFVVIILTAVPLYVYFIVVIRSHYYAMIGEAREENSP